LPRASKELISQLIKRSAWIRKETLLIHKTAPETRIASSLSAVEIFVVLYYGGILRFFPRDPLNIKRDRFLISKGHGAISLYPILADLGFFDKQELQAVCKDGTFLGGIPDAVIPGFETINGSLGHGPGVACGIALALNRKGRSESVFVLMGDGELYEGSVWEAIMFAGEHKLDNITLILDNNQICMLDYCNKILNLSPIEEKFRTFKWDVTTIDGHNVEQVHHALATLKNERNGKPKVLIANTIKGKGVKSLETDALCHIKTLKPSEIDMIVGELE